VDSYSAFFTGAATVAGALVGLLFVALSLSPERLRDSGSVEHQAIAATAFTALVGALFVTLIGLQTGAVIFGALGLSSTAGLAIRLWRSRHLGHLSNRWPFFLVFILLTYAAQMTGGRYAASGAPAGGISGTGNLRWLHMPGGGPCRPTTIRSPPCRRPPPTRRGPRS
jgi:hypothetical protein